MFVCVYEMYINKFLVQVASIDRVSELLKVALRQSTQIGYIRTSKAWKREK